MKAIDFIESGEKVFQKIFILIGASCLLGIVGVILLNVVLRYVFNSPLMWYLELCSILVVWLAFAIMGFNGLLGKHFVIDTFINLLPKGLMPLQKLIVDVACLTCIVLLIIATADVIAVNGGMTLNTIPITMTSGFYLPVGIGAATYFLVLILRYVKLALRGKRAIEGGKG